MGSHGVVDTASGISLEGCARSVEVRRMATDIDSEWAAIDGEEVIDRSPSRKYLERNYPEADVRKLPTAHWNMFL